MRTPNNTNRRRLPSGGSRCLCHSGPVGPMFRIGLYFWELTGVPTLSMSHATSGAGAAVTPFAVAA